MRYLKMKFILITGFLFSVMQVDAQEKEQLRSFLNLALENSHEIKKSKLQIEGASSQRKEVMAAGLPQVEGGLDYSRMGIPKINIPEDALSGLPEEIAPLLQGLAGIKAFHAGRRRYGLLQDGNSQN
jgi:Outer membrane protein